MEAATILRVGEPATLTTKVTFPFLAYALDTNEVVKIVSQIAGCWIISGGLWIEKRNVTRLIPDWALAEYAGHKAEEMRDLHDTQADALGVP